MNGYILEIIIKINGTMERFFPEKKISMVLEQGAVLSDLYEVMGLFKGPKLSRAVWNHDKNRFRGPVIVISENRLLKNEDETLYDGQIIEFKRALVGG